MSSPPTQPRPPSPKRCLVTATLFPGAFAYHLVPKSVRRDASELARLGYWFGVDSDCLTHKTDVNCVCLSPNYYETFGPGDWFILPELPILRDISSYYAECLTGVRQQKPECFYERWPCPPSNWTYTFHVTPGPSRWADDSPIIRKRIPYPFPFSTFPSLVSTAHPVFVIQNVARKAALFLACGSLNDDDTDLRERIALVLAINNLWQNPPFREGKVKDRARRMRTVSSRRPYLNSSWRSGSGTESSGEWSGPSSSSSSSGPRVGSHLGDPSCVGKSWETIEDWARRTSSPDPGLVVEFDGQEAQMKDELDVDRQDQEKGAGLADEPEKPRPSIDDRTRS